MTNLFPFLRNILPFVKVIYSKIIQDPLLRYMLPSYVISESSKPVNMQTTANDKTASASSNPSKPVNLIMDF